MKQLHRLRMVFGTGHSQELAMRSASARQKAEIIFRLRYLLDLLLLYIRDRQDFRFLREWEGDVSALIERFSIKNPSEMTAVEVGCGQRLGRLIWATGLFGHVTGIDLDRPMLNLSIGDAVAIARTNGILRALKTSIRCALFDREYYRKLSRLYQERYGRKPRISNELIIIGDAADGSTWKSCSNVDLIFSEDVFEHMPEDTIAKVTRKMAENLREDGLAVININLFTGITGGHVPEWYSGSIENGKPKRTRPWGHLRKERSTGDTYLNELRLRQYEEIFRKSFEILEVQQLHYGLGEELLTPSLEAELAQYTRQELLSNQARFVMRPHSGIGKSAHGTVRPRDA